MEWANNRFHLYDVMILACGYETRALYVLSQLERRPTTIVALDYDCQGVHSYDVNKKTLSESAAKFYPHDGPDFARILRAELDEVKRTLSELRPLTVLFDVSSCSRSVMAEVFLTLAAELFSDVELTCCYALSAFDSPPEGELPSSVSEPVIGELSGWSDDLSKPPCAVISLGFEPGRALGTIDYLEVPEVRLFMPRGPDDRFEKAVSHANQLLISEAGSSSVLPYDVLQPESTLHKLESLLFGLMADYRPVVIPLGPKIFSAISMILAIRMFPKICVWRTSAGSGEEIVDRTASGEISILRASPLSPLMR